MAVYEGTSNKGDLQEALEDALKDALTAVQHTDPMVYYTLQKISGIRGGIAGFNELTVSIEAGEHQGARRATLGRPRATQRRN